jgi:hypothetical protein
MERGKQYHYFVKDLRFEVKQSVLITIFMFESVHVVHIKGGAGVSCALLDLSCSNYNYVVGTR